jgi:hypothetical protein
LINKTNRFQKGADFLRKSLWDKRQDFVVITGCFVLSLLSVMLLDLWNDANSFQAKRDFLDSAVKTIGTVSTIVGAIILYQRFKDDRKKFEYEKQKDEKQKLAQDFSKAVEQLGNKDSLHVRIGGIYTLERIAQNHPDAHWTVMEVLTSFIRSFDPEKFIAMEGLGEGDPSDIITVPPDIQAAFTVVGRRNIEKDKNQINLSGAFLVGVDVSGLNFSHVNLSRANLKNSKFSNISFCKANLKKSRFTQAHIHDVNFKGSDLKDASFYKANLESVIFREANLSLTYFAGAKLVKSNFCDTDLSKALFSEFEAEQHLEEIHYHAMGYLDDKRSIEEVYEVAYVKDAITNENTIRPKYKEI